MFWQWNKTFLHALLSPLTATLDKPKLKWKKHTDRQCVWHKNWPAYNSSKNIKIACRMVSQNDIHSYICHFQWCPCFAFFLINANAWLFKSIALNIKKWCCKKTATFVSNYNRYYFTCTEGEWRETLKWKKKKCTPRQDYLGIIRLYFKAQMLWTSAGTVDCGNVQISNSD